MAEKVSQPASFTWSLEVKIKTRCPVCKKFISLTADRLYSVHTEPATCRGCGSSFFWKIGATKSEWYVEKFYEFNEFLHKMFRRWSDSKSVYFSRIEAKGLKN